MKEVSFYALPRIVQDRFLGALAERNSPLPYFRAKHESRQSYFWLGVSVGAELLLIVLLVVGFGSPTSAGMHHGAPWLAAYGGFVFLAVFGLARFLAERMRDRRFPFARGVYVFPACLVDARSEKLRVFSLDEATITGPEGPRGTVKFAFGGPSFDLDGDDPVRATEALTALGHARAKLGPAIASQDQNMLTELDPLFEPRFSSPVGPAKPRQREVLPLERFGWMGALGAAVVVGPLVWLVRNAASDDAAFRVAVEQNDVDVFRAYLERGSRHESEVADLLLPRAELAVAVKAKSVKALRGFIAAHPNSKIQKEVDGALRAALLEDLEAARKEGTLGAIHAFVKANPDHGLAAEVKAATHEVYKAALDKYKARAPERSGAVPFMEKLVAWAEKHGPSVEVRVKRRASTSLAKADANVSRSVTFMGTASLPSQYFAGGYVEPRERKLVAGVVERLQSAFPAELVKFEAGAALAESESPMPDVNVPTLVIEYGVEWTGSILKLPKPKGVYAGLSFKYEAQFRLPGEPKPFVKKEDVWKAPSVDVIRDEKDPVPGHAPSGSLEERVYEAMAQSAADQFQKKLVAVFLKN